MVAAELTTGHVDLGHAGLYSWWVDEDGAADLTRGVGHPVAPGLIYAGLTGATHWPSGKASSSTLYGRLIGNHLRGRARGSTFRLTLGSILRVANGWTGIDEPALSAWMAQHLRVVPVPVDDRDSLGDLETAVLTALDPPLNLSKMPASPVRQRLTELRRLAGVRSDGQPDEH